MKILYGSSFDSGYYFDLSSTEKNALFNTRIVGPQGLLGLLEQITGNTGSFLNNSERKVEFVGLLRAYIEANPEALFANSFKTDPVGVAAELLRYRDQLVLSGWNKNLTGVSNKIDLLCDIERNHQIPEGFEDRWIKILKVIETDSNLGFSEIKVYDLQKDLHPFFQNLFELFAQKGIGVDFLTYELTGEGNSNLQKLKSLILSDQGTAEQKIELDIEDKSSFQVLSFKTDIEAAHFFAEQQWGDTGPLVICQNSSVYDSVISTFHKPRPGTPIDRSNTTILQLFKLSSSLFLKPFSILNYLAYLQCPLHPVSKTLRKKVLKIITSTGGISVEDIIQTIDSHDFTTNKEPAEVRDARNSKKRKDAKLFLLPRDESSQTISHSEVVKFYKELGMWAVTLMRIGESLDDESKKQLMRVHGLSSLLEKAINQLGQQEIEPLTYQQLVKDVYEPIDVIASKAEKGSFPLILNPSQIITEPDRVIWLDFNNQEITPSMYDFFNDQELTALENRGCTIWDKQSQSEAAFNAYKRAIIASKKSLCLVITEKNGDEDCTDHPLYSYLKAKTKNLNDVVTRLTFPFQPDPALGFDDPTIAPKERISLPEKKIEYTINRGEFIRQRDTESFSSLDLMIQYPFDWVFQHGLLIKPGYTYDLPEVETTLGNVAHGFIHDLILSEEKNTARICQRLGADYDRLIEDAIKKYGAVLLLDENTFERHRLRHVLKESIQILIQIFKNNNLKIKDTELTLVKSLPAIESIRDQNFTGSIDLLLSDNGGNDVIFDLKWTRRDKRFSDKLREGKALQLALYKELVKELNGRPNVKTAFFLLSHGLLISNVLFEGDHVVCIDEPMSHDEQISRINNSIKFRRDQLAVGVIEEGEDEDLEKIPYYRALQEMSLLPLDFDSKGKKKRNYYSKYQVFKGGK